MQTTLALTDQELLDTVWSQLDQRLPAFGDGLRVSNEQGILTLSGSASHSLDHWTVAEAARSVPGVRALVDDINGDPTVCQTDRALAEHVIHTLT